MNNYREKWVSYVCPTLFAALWVVSDRFGSSVFFYVSPGHSPCLHRLNLVLVFWRDSFPLFSLTINHNAACPSVVTVVLCRRIRRNTSSIEVTAAPAVANIIIKWSFVDYGQYYLVRNIRLPTSKRQPQWNEGQGTTRRHETRSNTAGDVLYVCVCRSGSWGPLYKGRTVNLLRFARKKTIPTSEKNTERKRRISVSRPPYYGVQIAWKNLYVWGASVSPTIMSQWHRRCTQSFDGVINSRISSGREGKQRSRF